MRHGRGHPRGGWPLPACGEPMRINDQTASNRIKPRLTDCYSRVPSCKYSCVWGLANGWKEPWRSTHCYTPLSLSYVHVSVESHAHRYYAKPRLLAVCPVSCDAVCVSRPNPYRSVLRECASFTTLGFGGGEAPPTRVRSLFQKKLPRGRGPSRSRGGSLLSSSPLPYTISNSGVGLHGGGGWGVGVRLGTASVLPFALIDVFESFCLFLFLQVPLLVRC